jgi:PAS domain-containing protein
LIAVAEYRRFPDGNSTSGHYDIEPKLHGWLGMNKFETTMDSKKTMPLGQFQMRLLTFAVILTGIVLTWLSWSTNHSYQATNAAQVRNLRNEQLRGTIIHLDEVLTMSVRMASVTGDQKWEVRYRLYEDQLDSAINEAIASAPHDFSCKAAEETDAANIKLVEMENRAFELVRQGRADEAETLLDSPEYKTNKETYTEGMKLFADSLKDSSDDLLKKETSRTHRNIVFASAATILLSIVWIFVLRAVCCWRNAILESHDELEAWVQERTKALKASEIKFRTLYDSSQDAIMILTPGEGFIAGNSSTVSLYGCKDEREFTSCAPSDLSPEYQPDGSLSSVMPAAPGARLSGISAMTRLTWRTMLGIRRTRETKHIQLLRSNRMLGACTTCTVMLGNGAPICMESTITRRRRRTTLGAAIQASATHVEATAGAMFR